MYEFIQSLPYAYAASPFFIVAFLMLCLLGVRRILGL